MNEAVNEAYEKFRGDDGGKNADYIPFLANVPSQLFGISVCLPDGEIVEAGDTDYVFGVESVSKVPTAILAMEQYGPDTVLDQIGADATGIAFQLDHGHPARERPPFDSARQCGRHRGVQHGEAGRRREWQMESDHGLS